MSKRVGVLVTDTVFTKGQGHAIRNVYSSRSLDISIFIFRHKLWWRLTVIPTSSLTTSLFWVATYTSPGSCPWKLLTSQEFHTKRHFCRLWKVDSFIRDASVLWFLSAFKMMQKESRFLQMWNWSVNCCQIWHAKKQTKPHSRLTYSFRSLTALSSSATLLGIFRWRKEQNWCPFLSEHFYIFSSFYDKMTY